MLVTTSDLSRSASFIQRPARPLDPTKGRSMTKTMTGISLTMRRCLFSRQKNWAHWTEEVRISFYRDRYCSHLWDL